MKTRKLVGICLVLAMALSLVFAGCGQTSSAPATSTASAAPAAPTEPTKSAAPDAAKKIVIGCTFDYVSDFMAYVADGAKDYQTKNPGVEVVIQDAKKDVSNQLKDVENLIAQKVSGIVIKPVDVDACKPISDTCKAAGIPLVNCNSPMKGDVTSFVGSDNLLAGKLQAEYLFKQMGGKGTVNILLGDPNNQDSRDRTTGNKNVLKDNPDIKLGTEQVGKWARDVGMQVTENWIQSKAPMDAILANNDEMAIGAAKAAKEAGKKILIAGVDATPDALKMLKDGDLAVTVFQNGYQQGFIGVETAVKAAKGEKVEAKIDVPFELVTPDKADEYLAKYTKK